MFKTKRLLSWLVVVLFLSSIPFRHVTAEGMKIEAEVTAVTDGDTFTVKMPDGKKEKIRLLLVDTPETKHPDKPVQPFGPEASAYTTKILKGQTVELEFDVAQRDKYGRLLAYVYIGDKMLNELLLEKGYARVVVFQPNVKYVEQFRKIQKKAQAAKLGIWSLENYATDKPTATPKPTTKPKATTKPSATNKPAATKNPTENVYYKNCSAVRAAGAAPLHKGEPGYSKKLDRDGDGIACE
ncbi:thermonuclease family protein (plasmid) [Paenibacillus sonchi]|uniref:Thermonuclease family protein n=1 Tax=Paenibacillus sonchi TaxID=373687 RepID=A0A974SFY8_9BACL|nr:thermonuclease family protein [Paenibacillus sonchi]QQZ64497.1 thermonuclease family protein [Paenibacillus sonchi]